VCNIPTKITNEEEIRKVELGIGIVSPMKNAQKLKKNCIIPRFVYRILTHKRGIEK